MKLRNSVKNINSDLGVTYTAIWYLDYCTAKYTQIIPSTYLQKENNIDILDYVPQLHKVELFQY